MKTVAPYLEDAEINATAGKDLHPVVDSGKYHGVTWRVVQHGAATYIFQMQIPSEIGPWISRKGFLTSVSLDGRHPHGIVTYSDLSQAKEEGIELIRSVKERS